MILPEDFKADQAALAYFLRYIATPQFLPDAGIKIFDHHGAIYWPHFVATAGRSRVALSRFYDSTAANKRREQAGVHQTEGPVYRAWFAKDLRKEIERLLRPFLIHTNSPTGQDSVGYAYNIKRQLQLEHQSSEPLKIDPSAWATLTDLANYTFFRRLDNKRASALIRAMLLPPLYSEFLRHQPGLPDSLVALYHAWKTASERFLHPYDPREVGVEWTTKGYLAVHWPRFLASPFKPPVVATGAEIIGALYSTTKGNYYIRASALPDPQLDRKLPNSTLIIDEAEFEKGSPVTIVDTAYLDSRPEIWDSQWYARKARKKELRAEQRRAQLTASTEPALVAHVAKPRLTTVHGFTFMPFDYTLPEFTSYESPVWFPNDYEERVAAIKRGGEYYFAQPALLSEALKHVAPHELSAWFYAMDCVSCVAKFTETHEVDVEPVKNAKSEQIRAMKHQEYEITARQIIDDFLDLDQLSWSQKQRVKRETSKRVGRDPNVQYEGTRWYHERMLRIAKNTLPATAVRRRAFALIPGRNNDEPKEHPFYSVRALRQFKKAAQGILAAPDVDRPQNIEPPDMPAPYIYAWANFCIIAAEAKLLTPHTPAPRNQHWSPQEDLLLIQHYRRFPRMSTEESATLSRVLERHASIVVRARVRHLNRLLQAVLTGPRYERYSVGRLWLPKGLTEEEQRLEATRLVVVLGIASYMKFMGWPLSLKLPQVSAAFGAEYDALRAVILPESYRDERFMRLL